MAEPRRVYRARVRRSLPPPALLAYAVVVVVAFMIGLLNGGLVVAALSALGGLALCATLLALAMRPRTTVTGEGIDVRNVFETRGFRWTDIHGIGVARASMPGAGPAVLRVVIDVVIGMVEVRVHLPNVNARQLGDDRAVDRELARLREMWEWKRGDD
ncbi:MAG: PH domain-containing protein [Nocardiopsaceae bacterium]|nr:PH domain-containing protein [Nocardiopsaceae bacterium]